jgi:protein SCO1/2
MARSDVKSNNVKDVTDAVVRQTVITRTIGASRRTATAAARLALVAAGVLLWASTAGAQPGRPRSVPPPGIAATQQIPMLREVGVDQRLGEPVPLDTPFVDETGREVRLGDYFGTRPVVLALVYYECPMLCTQVLNGLVGSLEALTFLPGREFDVVVVSFDPGETPALAAEKKATYLRRYDRAGAEPGIHFLTGRPESVDALTRAVGFRYAYDAAIDQYAHPAAITVLTAEGRVSRYLFGIDFAPRDVRLALIEAADHQIGSALDQALLFCYHYDPETGTYGLAIMNMIRLAGLLTVGIAGTLIVGSLRRERRRRRAADLFTTGIR